jgi:hypothetical protein
LVPRQVWLHSSRTSKLISNNKDSASSLVSLVRSRGWQGLAQANQSAQTLANLGSAQQQSNTAMYGQQQATAAQQQALDQSVMTQQYQDFLNQRDYYNNQLAQYSSLLQGTPITPNTTTTSTAPAPSLASQIMGTGVGALGIAKTLGAI